VCYSSLMPSPRILATHPRHKLCKPAPPSSLQWLGWTAVMGYFALFTKLASLRGDALLSSPSATLAQHLRILALLGGILVQVSRGAGGEGGGSGGFRCPVVGCNQAVWAGLVHEEMWGKRARDLA